VCKDFFQLSAEAQRFVAARRRAAFTIPLRRAGTHFADLLYAQSVTIKILKETVMNQVLRHCAVGAALFAACNLANAHPGHALHASDGLAHPWQGLDHVLAMAGVGWWARQLGGAARLILPAVFVGAMALGLGAAVAGHAPPNYEFWAALSVLVIGLLVAGVWRTPTTLAACVVALFALAHGAAHGAGLHAQPFVGAYAAGVLLSTALLHGAGLLAAGAVAASTRLLRGGGLAMAVGGLYLLTT
jgi:urease accessory protein